MILRELLRFTIGGRNRNRVRYADETLLIDDAERKLQEILVKGVKETKKKILNINSKKTKHFVVSKKVRITNKLPFADTKMKQVQQV